MSTPSTRLHDAATLAVDRIGQLLQRTELDALDETASAGIQEALSALHAALDAPAATPWRRGDGSHQCESPSYVLDSDERIVATLNSGHPEAEANMARLLAAGGSDPVKQGLLAACREIYALYREDSDDWNDSGRLVDAMMEVSSAIKAADEEVSRG